MITDYASLQTAVNAFLNRPDFVSQVPLFIQLAEDQIKCDVEQVGGKGVTTFTVDNTAQNAIPADFDGVSDMTQVGAGTVYYYPYAQFDSIVQTTVGGRIYTIEADLFLWAPWLIGSQIRCLYKKQLVPLSNGNTTNKLLLAFPSLYLYAALNAAMLYGIEDDRAGTWQSMYQNMVQKANEQITERVTPDNTQMIKRNVV